MSQNRIQNQDFKSTASAVHFKSTIYTGTGSPNLVVTSPNVLPGCIYIDQMSSQLWYATTSTPSTYQWLPLGSIITNNIAIDPRVQEGDLVGIFGSGAWTATSANLNISRFQHAAAGSLNATIVSAGQNGTTALSSSELYNGSTWALEGNLSTSRQAHSGSGSLNASFVSGGASSSFAGTISSTELFNGTSWSTSGNMNISRYGHGAAGTQGAGIVSGGTIVSGSTLSSTELFNGSVWNTNGNMNATRFLLANAGSQNATIAVAGDTNSSGGTSTSVVEIFNGSTWVYTGNLIISRETHFSAGSQNATLISGGRNSGGLTNAFTNTELFNGSSWILSSGNMNVSRMFVAGSGVQSGALAIAGSSNGSVALINAEFHSQNTYRKLTYSDYPASANIGLAINTTNTSLTASVLTGLLPSNFVPSSFRQDSVTPTLIYNNLFFGISKFNNEYESYLLDGSYSCTNVSFAVTGQVILNMQNTLNWFFPGMLLSVTSGTPASIPSGIYPVVGGTAQNPIIRNSGNTFSGNISLSVFPTYGHRIGGLQVNTATTTYNNLPAINITVTIPNTTMTSGQFARLFQIGGVVQIPFGTNTATGSMWSYGAYPIQLISSAGNVLTVYQTRQTFLAENNISNVTVLQGVVINSTCLNDDDILLGLNSRMGLINNPNWDDSATGVV